ncbi:hypothetical protein FLJC2902T_13420 [Flavobacterium limnosediminis JC2902]|uniref:DNA 3'-5' helicase II n=1 Tax=Flavobacterium limnosediminis JC2902 TaxID=1341181 RepID=V6SPZ2_9FLAO|nr:hypothetical protein FLJC2902T_13420 [Flavobacterium limnosediminis JC2902]
MVLAHTNHAVEEIEKQLKPICPQLFEYPNFVGTIQLFSNRFIANQACFELYGSYIRKNDDEISENELISEFYKINFKSKLNGFIFNQLFSQYAKLSKRDLERDLNFDSKTSLELIKELKENKTLNKSGVLNYHITKEILVNDENSLLLYIKNIHDNAIQNVKNEKQKFCLRYKIDFINKKFVSFSGDLNFESESGSELLSYFEQSFKRGVLRYSDSISLSKYYITHHKELLKILQNRFKYVFIDEMQDLDQDQIDLIENIFFEEKSSNKIQRIGDKNQSIYSSAKSVSNDILWKTRNEIDPIKFPKNLSLNNSHRLTPIVAKLVDGFVLKRDVDYKVVGTSTNNNIAPHLIIYKDEKDGKELKNKFIELIKEHELDKGTKNLEKGYHIIGWTTEKEENSNKWYLKKIFPEYSKESRQKKEDFDSLRKYFFLFDREKKTLEAIRKSLLNGILRILRIEQIYSEPEKKKHFRKSLLIRIIKEKGEKHYTDFNQRIYQWCFSIVTKENYEEVFRDYFSFIENELVNYIPNFKITKSIEFVVKDFNFNSIIDSKITKDVVNHNDLDIKISSIHAVKGQTHCATMYVETEYFNFETYKLDVEIKKATKKTEAVLGNNPLYFQEQNFSELNKTRSNETLKMMYVGFSRPTHLLCFAVLEENVKKDIQKYKDAGWIVIDDLVK